VVDLDALLGQKLNYLNQRINADSVLFLLDNIFFGFNFCVEINLCVENSKKILDKSIG